MSLWGDKDIKGSTGLIAIDADGLLYGSTGVDATAFLTELRVGDSIVAGTNYYAVDTITDDNTATVIAGVAGGTVAATGVTTDPNGAGLTYVLSEKPVFVSASESATSSSDSGDPSAIYGVDTTEIGATSAGAHAGWVRRTTGTGGRAGRVFHEVLVASGTSVEDAGDAGDDTEFPDS